ncbi:hypothetical protein FisN_26Lu047 [Fistulifera solaris]|uniref:Uncharacterized protein n=1 Tax=Fistulifera solaris TaxID=1519565 RepID=A0A1Z5KCE2_FISSO|nr:hypothetical protein FisN_26Lu047 [Fistulifera solaris]|eukprot:GAX23970.1 hypothetical protein FisN_26Lu047 [Fistulifera solaris]
MKIAGTHFLLISSILWKTNFATQVEIAPELMSFEEKQVMMMKSDNGHRVLRKLQDILTYQGQICGAETPGVMTCNTALTVCQPNQFDYWLLNLRADITYTIEVDRVSCNLDPALSLFEGVGTTLPTECFGDNGSPELTLIATADDTEVVPAYGNPESSPFLDPTIVVTPSTTGPFTLAVVNFGSDTASCRSSAGYQYKIKINPRPSCITRSLP